VAAWCRWVGGPSPLPLAAQRPLVVGPCWDLVGCLRLLLLSSCGRNGKQPPISRSSRLYFAIRAPLN
jgi:hypothetical protein